MTDVLWREWSRTGVASVVLAVAVFAAGRAVVAVSIGHRTRLRWATAIFTVLGAALLVWLMVEGAHRSGD